MVSASPAIYPAVTPQGTPGASNIRTDIELMDAIVGRDEAAFAELYDRYGGIAYSLALQLTHEYGEAEDIVQETFLSIWRQAVRFSATRGTVRAWVLSMIHHRAIDYLRSARHRRQQGTDVEVPLRTTGEGAVEDEVITRIDTHALRAALHELPADQRRIVELAYLGGFTCAEIADQVGIPLGTVKSRIRIGLAKLRRGMQALGPLAAGQD